MAITVREMNVSTSEEEKTVNSGRDCCRNNQIHENTQHTGSGKKEDTAIGYRLSGNKKALNPV